MRAVVVLLGPQRFRPNLRATIESLGREGPLVMISAGWQEREAEHTELREHVGREVVDLLLYHRHDDVLLRDRELAAALRERQERLHAVQELYRVRLDATLGAARELMFRERQGPLLAEQQRAAIRSVRSLDREHVRRLRRMHDEFQTRWRPLERPAVARHREQLGALLRGAAALAIAGGHVSVLVNRLRLFALGPLVGSSPVVAWSAGAMAVSERIVLFHDSPPQGAGNPEVLDVGLGLCRGIVALPHAARRLRLDDPVRVALFARRFAPATCVVLEPPSRLDWDGEHWHPEPGTRALTRRGRVREMLPA